MLHTMKNVRLTGLSFLAQRCFLKHVGKQKIYGMIEETERRGRRLKQLLIFFKDRRGCWKLKVEAVDRILWKTGCGRGYGLVVRQTTE